MKKIIMPFLGLSILAMGVFAQDRLELTAKMPELVNGDVVFLWNPVDKTADSTYVKNNSFSFSKVMMGGGSTFILQAGLNPETTGLGIAMYLESGKMHIEGNGSGFKSATMTGDAFVSDWVTMQKELAVTFDNSARLEELYEEFDEAKKAGDEAASRSISAEMNLLGQKIAAGGRKWIDSHLSSGVSTYVLNATLARLLGTQEKLAYLNKFTGNARNQLTTQMLASLSGSTEQWLNKQAPDFVQPDANGKAFSLKDFKGKYVLVDFWASWCNPCRLEIPKLKATYEKFKNKNFTIVSVSLDNDKVKWMEALAQEKMPWLQLSELKGNQSSAAQIFKVMGLPANFLIDPDGKIIATGFRNTEPGMDILDAFLSNLFK